MQQKARKGGSLSVISLFHYFRLFYRSALLLAALVIYLLGRFRSGAGLVGLMRARPTLLFLLWLVFLAEVLLRFFAPSFESMGSRKHLKRNFVPAEVPAARGKAGHHRGVAGVAAAWLGLNGIIAALYFLRVIDMGILLLIAMAYAVCDMICILFFCPFQTWFMKNRCCVSCRIYNWDFAMMFTPLALIPHFLSWSLLAMGLLLLLQWEVSALRHPERFRVRCNAALACSACSEKLCRHKRQLRSFLTKRARLLRDSVEELRESVGDRFRRD